MLSYEYKWVTCKHCGKKMNTERAHNCYNKSTRMIHRICEDKVCHSCWDQFLKEAVEDAEAQFL